MRSNIAGDNLNERAVCGKAKEVYADLLKEPPGTSAENAEFKASWGRFEKFKKTRSFVHQGEVASFDAVAAEESHSSEPQPGPSEPQLGPQPGPSKPQPGPSKPQTNPSEPQPGPSEPQPSASEPKLVALR